MNDVRWRFRMPTSDTEWRQFAWRLSALAADPRDHRTFVAKEGQVRFEAVAEAALRQLQKEQAFLMKFARARRPDLVQKKKQGIFRHTCGGLHFVQGAVRAAGQYPNLRGRVQAQLELTRFRWSAERRIYRRLADLQPKYRPVLLVQELKFYGHLLETMALAVNWKIIPATDDLKAEMRMVAGDLLDTIQALEPIYGRLDGVRNVTPQTYYDLIGDACHAIRGLREALVAFYDG